MAKMNWRDFNGGSAVGGGVDDGLTSLDWLHNLSIMTRIGAPTPPTPPASPTPMSGCQTATALTKTTPERGDRSCGLSWSKMKGNLSNRSTPSSVIHKAPVDEVDYKTNGGAKPPYSYATLICMAMHTNKNKMTLSAIYKWIRENFMYYRNAEPSWQNSIRHNLSLNKSFIKVPRSKDEPGKGGFWRLDPQYAQSLVDGVFKKRRTNNRTPTTPLTNAGYQGGTATGPPTSKRSKKDKGGKGQLHSGVATAVAIATARSKAAAAAEVAAAVAMATSVTESMAIKDDPHESSKMEPITPPSSAGSELDSSPAVATKKPPNVVVIFEPAFSVHEALAALRDPPEPPDPPSVYETCTSGPERSSSNESCDVSEDFRSDLCWNSILTDTELDLDTFERFRTADEPSARDSSDLNSASDPDGVSSSPPPLALIEDFFPSAGCTTGDFDLESGVCDLEPVDPTLTSSSTDPTSSVLIGSNGLNPHYGLNPALTPSLTADWWSCFGQNTLNDFVCISQSLLNLPPNLTTDSYASLMTPVTPLQAPSSSSPFEATPLLMNDLNLGVNPEGQQPWAECKAALEAAALDLESLTDMDTVPAF